MEIEWLEDYLVLSSTLNFSRAAELRNLTQPAFSRRIKQLEGWLGTTLVDRSCYPAALTAEGEEFLRVAKETLQQLYEQRDYFQGRGGGRRRAFVNFSMVHTLAASYFPEWLRRLERKTGRIYTQVSCGSTHGCVQGLLSGSIDFFISHVHPAWPILLDQEQYPSTLLGRTRLVPVVAPDRAGRPQWSLDDVDHGKIPYLECAPNTITGKMVDVILGMAPHRPALETQYRNTYAAALKTMALAGRGLTWMPEYAVLDDLEHGRLMVAGSQQWTLPMDIRIYRGRKASEDDTQRVWDYCLSLTD